jgi:hypothetical protein
MVQRLDKSLRICLIISVDLGRGSVSKVIAHQN